MKIAVFFPGIGYHCDKPLLYFSKKIVSEHGFDKIISLDYSYDGSNIRGNKEKMKEAFDVLYAQAEEALKDIDFKEYDEILFVSKSVGTIIASVYAQKHSVKSIHVLLTPLEETFMSTHDEALAFIGSNDPWSDVNNVVNLAGKQNVPIKVYEGLNHSLEGPDTLKNLNILQDVIKTVNDYIESAEYSL